MPAITNNEINTALNNDVNLDEGLGFSESVFLEFVDEPITIDFQPVNETDEESLVDTYLDSWLSENKF